MSLIRPCIAAMLLGVVAPASADFHLMSIREVYVGPAGNPNAQYVELQMYEQGQHHVQGHSLTLYGPTGTLLGTLTFPTGVENGENQSFILIATNEAATLFGLTADLVMTPLLDPAGGRVCFDTVDCFSWGSYSGEAVTPSPSGNPFNPGGGLTADSAATRDLAGGTSATLLDANDDTNDSAADFSFAAQPDPHNNAEGNPGACDIAYEECPDPPPGGGGPGGGYQPGGGGGGGGAQSVLATLLLLLLGGLVPRRRRTR